MIRGMVLAGLTAMAAWAGDVSGKWKGAISTGPDGGPIEVEFNFKQDGGKLTGSVIAMQGEREITDGKVEGDKVSFAVERSSGKVLLSGTVSGDDLKMVVDAGDRKLDLTAKRTK